MIKNLKEKIKSCDYCTAFLPLGPHPVFRFSETSRILIIGQAPGTRVHETGIPWNDKSGDRLREWLQLDKNQFYDESKIAIMPMGFCYPGRLPNGGDAPPRPECAPLWHEKILKTMPDIEITLLVGLYAQKYYLKNKAQKTLTDTVKQWKDYRPNFFPLPHPSWRNTAWIKKNPWFEKDLLPDLREKTSLIL